MQETQFWSLGWEDPLEKRTATHSSMLAWRIPMDRGAWWATVHGSTASDMTQWLHHHHQWKASVFHSGFCFRLFVDQSAGKLFLKGKKWRRAQFLPLPAVFNGVTVVQVIEANDISWMLVRRPPRWEFFLPWVVLLSQRGRGSESGWRRQLSPWRTASNGLNIRDHKPVFWRCLEGENYFCSQNTIIITKVKQRTWISLVV